MGILKTIFRFVFRFITSLFLLLLAGLLAVVIINGYVRYSVEDRIFTLEEIGDFEPDCILVLGAGVWGDRPSPMLEDRLLTGIALYEKGLSDRLLVSGDHGKDHYDEVNVMKRYAVERGVPSSHIFMDHAGFSTYDSLYRAREVFLVKKVAIVTQKYHLYRALYIAKGLGLEAVGVSSDLRPYAGQEFRDLREILARVKDFLYVILKPLPTQLGEPVPVWGDGDLTND
jgi:SanA protein